jgi:RNA polymerase sigma factor (sigma-70 family)
MIVAIWPTPEEGLQLHQRLVQQDPTASRDLFTQYSSRLVAYLRQQNPRLEEDYFYDAANDAIVSLLSHPDQYDPTRLDLGAFLRMAATGDLRNLLTKESRKQQKRDFGVELDQISRKEPEEELDPLDWNDSGIQEIVSRWNTDDQKIASLIREGERKVESFAAILGISHLAIEDQRKQVKQVKDRLIKRLQRGVQNHE